MKQKKSSIKKKTHTNLYRDGLKVVLGTTSSSRATTTTTKVILNSRPVILPFHLNFWCLILGIKITPWHSSTLLFWTDPAGCALRSWGWRNGRKHAIHGCQLRGVATQQHPWKERPLGHETIKNMGKMIKLRNATERVHKSEIVLRCWGMILYYTVFFHPSNKQNRKVLSHFLVPVWSYVGETLKLKGHRKWEFSWACKETLLAFCCPSEISFPGNLLTCFIKTFVTPLGSAFLSIQINCGSKASVSEVSFATSSRLSPSLPIAWLSYPANLV